MKRIINGSCRFYLSLKTIVLLIIVLSFVIVFIYFALFKDALIIGTRRTIIPETCLRFNHQQFVSTCSCKADNRGLGQKVIAFSLYGNFSHSGHVHRYVEPMKAILANITRAYPGWTVRIYSPLEDHQNNKILKKIFKDYPFVDLCNITRVIELLNTTSRLHPMTWRFLPLLDPTVDLFMSRDSDSLIWQREVDAVNEWLHQSQATFHIMRDHKMHFAYILGGMWGAKVDQKRQEIQAAAWPMFSTFKHEMGYAFDQDYLYEFVWPLAYKDAVSHDSYLCDEYPLTRPFPSKRQGSNFVGQIGAHQSANEVEQPVVCPRKCRPKDHPDWIYC